MFSPIVGCEHLSLYLLGSGRAIQETAIIRPFSMHFLALVFPCTGAYKVCKAKGPLFPMMANWTILCYICSWSHGSLHVYTLVGGLVPGSFGGSGWLILLFMGLQSPSAPSVLPLALPQGLLDSV